MWKRKTEQEDTEGVSQKDMAEEVGRGVLLIVEWRRENKTENQYKGEKTKNKQTKSNNQRRIQTENEQGLLRRMFDPLERNFLNGVDWNRRHGERDLFSTKPIRGRGGETYSM